MCEKDAMEYSALSGVLDQVSGRWGVPYCETVVRVRHCVVWSASRRAETADAVPGNSLFWLYSITKIFTASLALQLWEEGALQLEDPVSAYLPEYSGLLVKTRDGVEPSRTPLTIRHLLTMTSGISYDDRATSILSLGGIGSTRDVARAIAKMPLAFEPGEHFLYGFSFDVLAAVLEILTGERFGNLLRRRIMEPLEIRDAGFFPDGPQKTRIAPQYVYDFRTKAFLPAGMDCTARLTDRHESGGGGLCATMEGVSRLCDALACGGMGQNGVRILREETVALMHENALDPVQLGDFAAIGTVKPGYGYGFGVRTLTEKSASPGPVGEFGWSGAAGSWVLMDPVHGISMVFFQHALSFLPAFDTIHNALRDALYKDLAGFKIL